MMYSSRRSARRFILRLNRLEERLAPAVFNIADGDVGSLIAAVNIANTNAQSDLINLAVNGTYDFTVAADQINGANAIPAIQLDGQSSNAITVVGNGSTFARTGSAFFRFFNVTENSSAATLIVDSIT